MLLLLGACGAPAVAGDARREDRVTSDGARGDGADVEEPSFEDVFFAADSAGEDASSAFDAAIGADSARSFEPPAEPPAGAPIASSGSGWQWVPVPEAKCMNGSPTGFGVNFSRGSNRLLIVLEGGGACFNDATCTVGTLHADGFNESTFRAVMAALGSSGTFNRNNANNPFASWNYVFVPYCSGDIHGGNVERTSAGRTHLGYRNIGHYLARIAPTFASVSSVVLAGSSAGGFGAAWNYDRTARVFAPTPVHLLDDSGPIFSSTYLKPCLLRQFRAAWNLDSTMPSGCASCRDPDASMLDLLRFVMRRYPAHRFGLVSSDWDAVIRTFLGYGYSPTCTSPGFFAPTDYQRGLIELRATVGSEFSQFKSFLIPGDVHTWLMTDLQFSTRIDGVSLAEWSGQLAYGDASWRDVGR